MTATTGLATLKSWLAPLLLMASSLAAAPAPAVAATRPTVVWIVFDETNLPMLLTSDQRIDGRRYPNLARLAGTATWYRNAVGIDNFTPRAVPGMLASRDGSGDLQPTVADFPVNAFTLLRTDYRIDALQQITDLCPRPTCPGLGPGFDPAHPVDFLRRIAHGPAQQFQLVRRAAARMRRGEAPTFHFIHVLIPHRPWRATPDGRQYEYQGQEIVNLNPQDPWLAAERAQRLAVQDGLLDTSLARIRARLVAQGLWDGALVIVTADHGINLEPGSNVREPSPTQLDELYRVPLLIKAPGQRVGAVTDKPVSTIDILPTLLAMLGRARPASLQGIDMRGPVAADRARLVWSHQAPHPFEAGLVGLRARLAVYDAWFPAARAGWARILRVGRYGRLLGTGVPARLSGVPGSSWTRLLPKTPRADRTLSVALVSARVTLPGGRRPADGAVVVVHDGHVAGLLGGAVPDHGGYRVVGMVDWLRFRDGPLALRLALATGDPAHPRLRWLTQRAARATRPTAA